jgi:glycosyltransferase involved in cell wall biosynthesis
MTPRKPRTPRANATRATNGAPPAKARRIRVCLVTTEFHGLFRNGGIGTANTGLALALAAAGHEVTVAFADADHAGPRVKEGNFAELQDRYGSLGIALDYVPAAPHIPKAFDDCRSASYCVYLYLKSHSFDVVYFNDCGGHGYYSLLAKHVGVFREAPRMYVVAHGPHEWVLELNSLRYWKRDPVIAAFLERRCAELADALISPSQHLVDWMISRRWAMPQEVRVVQNIVRLPDSLSPSAMNDKPGKIAELVFFGRLEIRKGIELFCDAIDALGRSTDLAGIKITFMGKFSMVASLHSGMYLVERARSWRSSLRILSNFDQEEALAYLNRSGILAVIPSFAENSPCVVAECLQLGVPFLATSGGGTVELVAPEDRDFCLVPTDSKALAASLARILQSGQRTARMAVSQETSLAKWLRLTESGTGSEHKNNPALAGQPLVSACVAASPGSTNGKEFLDSLREQTYPSLELLLAEAAEDPGSRRNAAAEKATGDYLLFADESCVALTPECVDTLVAAALRTGTDVVAAMPARHGKLSADQSETGPASFPIGACLELGALENCFGDGLVLVKRSSFQRTAGFQRSCDPEIAFWLFLAESSLAGLSLEVVPEPLFRQAKRRAAAGYRSTFVGNQRRILDAFRGEKIERVRHIFESISDIERVDTRNLNEALQTASPEAREIARRVSSSWEPNSDEAIRGFVQFCVERKKIEEALDYALHNKRSLLSDLIGSAKSLADDISLDAVRGRTLDLWHMVVLTDEVRQRIKPVAGVRPLKAVPVAGGVIAQPIQAGLSVFKATAVCPPLAGFLRAVVKVAAPVQPAISLALVATAPDARLRLSDRGLESSDAFWWSAWVPAKDGGRKTEVTVAGIGPVDQLLDLHFLCKVDLDATDLEGQVVWESVAASVPVEGVISASVIEIEDDIALVPPQAMENGVLLSETTDFPFPVYVPGDETLLHPLPGRAALVRLPGAVPRGTTAVKSVVSLELAEAHPTQFAVWVRRASNPAEAVADFTPADAFSGWFSVADQFRRHSFTARLHEPADEAMDLYLATRVVEFPDVYFCHAVWHELLLLK